MKTLELIDALARQARREMPPALLVDLGPGCYQLSRPASLAPLAWSAGVALLAACLAVMMAVQSTPPQASVDAVAGLFTPTQVEMP